MLKSAGDNNHPWRTPTVVLKNLPVATFIITALFEFL